MINVYPASVLYRWCKVVYNHQNKYNGPRLHLGLIEEIKAAFIDFLPAGTVLY